MKNTVNKRIFWKHETCYAQAVIDTFVTERGYMEELKIIYGLITSIWKLCRKYGIGKLTCEQWESFIEDGKKAREFYLARGVQYDVLYRGMFSALQDYYIQKKDEQGKRQDGK